MGLSKYEVKDIRNATLNMEENPELAEIKGTFYYDETNNSRKFWLMKEDGFNCPENENFVLGGVMYFGNGSNSDVDQLFKDLRIQKTAKEVKLKHIANGTFLECLNSDKLNFFLNWLYESDLYLHYSSINNLYFALVDIVDSCLGDIEIQAYGEDGINMLKSELFRLASDNFQEFYSFLYAYNYPNVASDKAREFCDYIITMIDMDEEKIFWMECLRQLIKQGKRKEELTFLKDNKKSTIIDDYSDFYIRAAYIFKNSYHTFDKEDEVERRLANVELYHGEEKLSNYRFLDSKTNKMIWISDIITGLIGKYFTYINDIKIQNIDDSLNKLTEKQRECLNLFSRIIMKSDSKNYMFIHPSLSIYEHSKSAKVLEAALTYTSK